MIEPPPQPPPPPPVTATIEIVQGRGGPRFRAPRRAPAGAVLRIVNRTDPARVGPHTFSLVGAAELPRGRAARRACFSPEGICRAVADWHGVRGNGPPAKRLARAGLPGWDLEGDLGRRGDSWFSGYRPGASIEQALGGAAPRTIHFLCAIHPWMQGSLRVAAPTSEAPPPAAASG